MIKAGNISSPIPPAPAVAAAAPGIRDIKPPVVIPNFWEWVWWGIGAAAVLAVLYLVWRYWRKRRSLVSVEPPVPAHIRAKQKLEEALVLIAQPKPFCIAVSDTVRFYLEEQFNFHAPERTTEEFLRELSATDRLSPEQKESLGHFLENCDLVKFAKYEPGENDLRELHRAAVMLVEETEPREILDPMEGTRDWRGEPGVPPDSAGAQHFRQDAENSTRDASPSQNAFVNRKS